MSELFSVLYISMHISIRNNSVSEMVPIFLIVIQFFIVSYHDVAVNINGGAPPNLVSITLYL